MCKKTTALLERVAQVNKIIECSNFEKIIFYFFNQL